MDDQEEADGGTQDTRSPMAKAMDISTRLMTMSLCMALPIVAGYFLDKQFGTVVLFLLVGLAFGMLAAGVQLMKLLAPGGVLSSMSEPKSKSK